MCRYTPDQYTADFASRFDRSSTSVSSVIRGSSGSVFPHVSIEVRPQLFPKPPILGFLYFFHRDIAVSMRSFIEQCIRESICARHNQSFLPVPDHLSIFLPNHLHLHYRYQTTQSVQMHLNGFRAHCVCELLLNKAFSECLACVLRGFCASACAGGRRRWSSRG